MLLVFSVALETGTLVKIQLNFLDAVIRHGSNWVVSRVLAQGDRLIMLLVPRRGLIITGAICELF